MKEKILVQLKTKFKTLGLSDKVFDGVAEYLSTTITEETEIEGRVKNSEGLLKAVQTENDRRTTELVQKNKTLEKELDKLKSVPQPEQPISTPDNNGEIPGWAKKLTETQNTIIAKQKQDDTLRQISSLKANVAQKLITDGKIDKRLCDKIVSRIDISDGDTVDTLYEKSVNEYNELKTVLTPEAGATEEGGYTPKDNHIDDYFTNKKKEIADEQEARKALLGDT